MWADEPDTLDTVHAGNRPQKIAEPVVAMAVGIYGLPEQRNFARAFRGLDRGLRQGSASIE